MFIIILSGIILSSIIQPIDKKEEEPIGLNPIIETEYLEKGEPITITSKEHQQMNSMIEQLSHVFDIELLRNLGGS